MKSEIMRNISVNWNKWHDMFVNLLKIRKPISESGNDFCIIDEEF